MLTSLPNGENACLLALIFASALGLMALLHFFIEKTKMGKAMRACSDDLETAGLMGINSDMVIAVTFLVGELLKLVLVERLFHLTRDKLMRIPAFAWAYGKYSEVKA